MTRFTLHSLLCSILLLTLSGWVSPGWASLEINGLIIDQTRTRIGQDVYRQFSSMWGEVQVDFPFNITLKELPDARWGSLLIIEVNGRQAYRNTLRPRADKIKEEVQKAILGVRRYLLYLIRTNGDQQSSDLRGNGY